MFTDTNPKIGDSDNNLLFKIAQALNSGAGGGGGGGGGGGDSLWQFSGGSIHPIVAARSITSYNGNFIANPGAADGSPALAVNTTATHSSGNLFLVANNGTPKLSVNTDGGIVSDGGATLNGALSVASGTGFLNGEIPDGSTPYVFNTSLAHTSGHLVEFKNNGDFSAAAFPSGNLRLGKNTDAFYGASDSGEAIVCVRDTTLGEAGNSGYFFGVNTADGVNAIENVLNTTISYFHLQAVLASQQDHVEAQAKVGESYFRIKVASTVKTLFRPDIAASSLPYLFDTSVNHTSGLLATFNNNGASVFSVDYNGQLIAGKSTQGRLSFGSGAEEVDLQLKIETDLFTRLHPSSADSVLPYLFDTSVNHTSGLLVDFKNSGTSKFSVDFAGGITGISASITNGVSAGNFSSTGDEMTLDASAADGIVAFKFDTNVSHTSGNLLSIGNNGVAKAWVTFDGELHAKDFVMEASAVRTNTGAGHQGFFQAYDEDAAVFKTFATLTNGNTPTFVIAPPSGGTVSVDANTFKVAGVSGADGSIVIPGVATLTVSKGIITAIV